MSDILELLVNDIFELQQDSKQDIRTQKEELQTQEKFECDRCGFVFGHQRSLKRHRQMVNCDGLLLCNVCGKVCKTNSGLNLHLKVHQRFGSLICSVCNADFVSARNFIYHVKRNVCGKNRHCPECIFEARTSSGLARHLLKHRKQKPPNKNKKTKDEDLCQADTVATTDIMDANEVLATYQKDPAQNLVDVTKLFCKNAQ